MFAGMEKLSTFATATTKNTRFFQSGVAGFRKEMRQGRKEKVKKVFADLKF